MMVAAGEIDAPWPTGIPAAEDPKIYRTKAGSREESR